MKIRYAKAASRALSRTHKRRLLLEKIELLANNPDALAGNIVQLAGRPEQRLRVQDWRVIFHWDDDTLVVLDVAPRGSAYEDRS